MTCEKCGRQLENDDVSMGANLGFGPFYVCFDCMPPGTAEEIIESIDLSINPREE